MFRKANLKGLNLLVALGMFVFGANQVNAQTNGLNLQNSNGDTLFVVSDSGKVGIGVISPNEKLSVDGTISLGEGNDPTGTIGYGKLHVGNDGNLYFTKGSGEKEKINDPNDELGLLFHAYLTGTQGNINSYPFETKLSFDGEIIDNGNYHSNGTFTAPADGDYLINFYLRSTLATSSTPSLYDLLIFYIRKNGNADVFGGQTNDGEASSNAPVFQNYSYSTVVSLQAGDILEVYLTEFNGGSEIQGQNGNGVSATDGKISQATQWQVTRLK